MAITSDGAILKDPNNSTNQTLVTPTITGGTITGATISSSVIYTGHVANHIIYVDGGRTDTYTPDGTMLNPYTTIKAAADAINTDSAAHAVAGHYELTNYKLIIASGTYSDNLTFNNQKLVRLEGQGVFITGTIALTQTQQGGDYYSRIEFVGMSGIRAEKGPAFKLAGNITGTRNNDSLTYVVFDGVWITGNQLYDTDGTWVTQYRNSRIAGTINSGTYTDPDSAVLIETMGWNEFAGTIGNTGGKISLYNVTNADFWGVITITPIFDCYVSNSRFNAATSIVAVKNLYIDAASYKSLLATTEILTGMTVVHIDGGYMAGTSGQIPVGVADGTNPAWTTSTGSDAPVRATSPTVTTPTISGGAVFSGSAITAPAADTAKLGNADTQGAAGYNRLHTYTEDGKYSSLALRSEINESINPRIPSQSITSLYVATGVAAVTVADNSNLDMGTNNFSVIVKTSLSDWTPSATVTLAQKTDETNGWKLQVFTTGYLVFTINTTSYTSSVKISDYVADGATAKIEVDITRSSVSVAGSVIFKVNSTPLGVAQTIAAGAPTTVSNASSLYLLGDGTKQYAGTLYFAALYNRALSTSDGTILYNSGIDFADKWASQTAKYTSDFAAGEDGWAGSNGTAAGNIDSIGGQDDTLRLTIGNTSATHYMGKSLSLVLGKRYRVSFSYYLPSTNSNLDGIRADNGRWVSNHDYTTLDAWTAVSFEDVYIGTNGYLYLYGLDGTATTFQDAAGDDVFYVKSIVITEIGPVIALEPEGILPGAWADSSSNKFTGTYAASGVSINRMQGKPVTTATQAATGSLYANDFMGQVHRISGNYTLSFCPALVGMSASFMATSAAVFHLDPSGSEIMVLDSSALTGGSKISSAGAIYDRIYCECTVAGVWDCRTVGGIFVDGG